MFNEGRCFISAGHPRDTGGCGELFLYGNVRRPKSTTAIRVFDCGHARGVYKHFVILGGSNAAGNEIPDGGFDPIVSLFDPSGKLLQANDDWFGFTRLSLIACIRERI
jgi:hypothetical protein